MTRREALRKRRACGFGMLGLAGLLASSESGSAGTLVARTETAAFPAKAKHVIFLFLNGGPSHVDTFDPKPTLSKYNGKPVPAEHNAAKRTSGTTCWDRRSHSSATARAGWR